MDKVPKTKLSRLIFTHYWPADYKIYPVNGTWGGMTGRGDLVLHFFVERHEVPKEEVSVITEDGTLAPIKLVPKGEQKVARDMQTGIMVNREQAVSIAKWILEKVGEYEKLVKGKPKK